MRYHYQNGVKQKQRGKALWIVFPVVALAVGGYILINTFSPAVDMLGPEPDATAKKLQAEKPILSENRIYVPKVNIDVAVVDINGDEASALERGAIHRAADNGNPKDGGNYVVAGHRFQLGWNPNLTRKKSPFYHIDRLSVGDQIYVDYDGTRYAYEIKEKKKVPKNALEVEDRTDKPRLTMYSCDLRGPEAGREVVIAEPVGTVAWVDGQPKLRTLN
jgi:sortase A